VDIAPFTDADLDGAGALLAARHRAHRAAEPLLAARYTEVDAATRAVAELWHTEGASGVVARAGGRAVGYLLGVPKADDAWGPNVWVEPAGHAVVEAETVRDLYAVAAEGWVGAGRTAHYVLVPATGAALVDAWFRLGFGQQQVHGIRSVPAPGPPPAPADGVVVRRARPDDAQPLVEVDLALPRHQTRSPVFSGRPIPPDDLVYADLVDTIGDPEYAMFVAELDGVLVGEGVGWSVEKSSGHRGLAGPDAAGLLGFAAVLPQARGRGVGRALGEAVLAWMTEAGYRVAVTDWRAANLLSSRTWPRLGFRPSFLRLHRKI
jgi:GNAT superfamily N-acetyltransferase